MCRAHLVTGLPQRELIIGLRFRVSWRHAERCFCGILFRARLPRSCEVPPVARLRRGNHSLAPGALPTDRKGLLHFLRSGGAVFGGTDRGKARAPMAQRDERAGDAPSRSSAPRGDYPVHTAVERVRSARGAAAVRSASRRTGAVRKRLIHPGVYCCRNSFGLGRRDHRWLRWTGRRVLSQNAGHVLCRRNLLV